MMNRFIMRRLVTRLTIASITFLVGIGIASISLRRESIKRSRLFSGPPCAQGLVSVEPQSQAPLRISILDTACRDSYSASVQFVLENMGSKPIIKYEIQGTLNYDGLVDEGIGVSTEWREAFQPLQKRTGVIGGGVLKVGQLRGFKLAVRSVDFADGTKWSRSLPR
jgi:hypothetical protein